MKKLLVFALLATAFFACKKDDHPGTDKPAAPDPNVLTASLQVQYGKSIKGTMPVGTGAAGAPVLNTASGNQVIPAINGRYAVIRPDLTSGKFKGYYLKVSGADSYFKVDFSQPKSGARMAKGVDRRWLKKDGNDSIIIIKLPQNATTDTISIEYSVYDSTNAVSNVIKAIITILSPAGGAAGTPLVGNWQNYRYKTPTENEWHLTLAGDTSRDLFYCRDTSLVYAQPADLNTFWLYTNYHYTVKDEGTFNSDGTFKWDNEDTDYILVVPGSSCAHQRYDVIKDNTSYSGGWSYNPATKKLLMVLDQNGQLNAENFDIIEHTITEITATKMVITSPDGGMTELVKK